MKKMLPGLDVLRFLLACYLVLYHTLYNYPAVFQLPFLQLFRFGGCATSTFFVLSGFILSHVYIGSNAGDEIRIPSKKFFVNRLTNLYPIHIITLLLTLALMAVTSHPFEVALSALDSAHEVMHTMGRTEVGINLVLQVLLLQAWNPFYIGFNIPAWSISTLLFFYLFFPAVAPRLLSMRHKWTMLTVLWLACLTAPLTAIVTSDYGVWMVGTLHRNPLVRLPEFLAGIVAYGIYARHAEAIRCFVTRRRRSVMFALGAFFIGAAAVYAKGIPAAEVLLHNGAILPAQIALIVVCAGLMQDASPRVADWSRRLGNAALSIFALQIPLFIIFRKTLEALSIPYPLLSCFHQLHTCANAASQVPLRFSAYPVYLLLVLVVAVLFQERIIAPLRGPLRRLLTRPERTPVVTPASALAPSHSEPAAASLAVPGALDDAMSKT